MIKAKPLAVALAISLAANAGLCWAWLSERDAAVRAGVERDGARETASLCSDATADLRELADKRKQEAAAAQAAARRAGQPRLQRADEIMATPASAPGDDCRSAHERAQRWLQARGAKQ